MAEETTTNGEDYGLSKRAATRAMEAPDLPYRPRDPRSTGRRSV
jgi:hypothetical protein